MEEFYENARDEINYDKILNSLEPIREGLEKSIEGIKDAINERTAEIIIQHGLGYKSEVDLRVAFQKFPQIENINRVRILTLSTEDGMQIGFYYSQELKIIIKGEPEKREDGLYCRITGTNLSKL